MTVKELIVSVKYKSDDKSIKDSESKMSAFGKKAGKVMGGVATSIAAILTTVAIASVKAAGDMEMLTTQFEVMLGSAEKANAMMDQLKQFASTTPFSLEDLSKGTQNLLSFGVAEDKVIQTMRMLGDTAGGNAEKLNSLVGAYGKVQVKGKAGLEELNMMAERGLPIYDTLAKQLGMTKEEFMSMKGGVKVSAEEVEKAFQTMTSEGGMFYQGMQKQSMTFQGMLSTLKDNITLTLAGIGEKLLPPIKKVMDKITQLLQGKIGEALDRLITKLIPLIDIVFGIIDQVFNNLDPVIAILEQVLDMVIKIIQSALPATEQVITILFNDLIPVIKDILDLFFALIEPLLPIISIVAQLINMLLLISLKPVLIIIQLVAKVLTFITKIIMKFLAPFLNGLDSGMQKIGQIIQGFVMPIFDKFIKGFDKLNIVGEKIMQVFRFIGLIIATIVSPAIEFLKQKFDEFKTFIEPFILKLQELFDGLAQFFNDNIMPIIDFFAEKIEWLMTQIQEFFAQFEWFSNIISKLGGMWDSVKAPKSNANTTLENKSGQDNKTVNVNANNTTGDINITGNVNNPTEVANAVQVAIGTQFNIELKKILVEANI